MPERSRRRRASVWSAVALVVAMGLAACGGPADGTGDRRGTIAGTATVAGATALGDAHAGTPAGVELDAIDAPSLVLDAPSDGAVVPGEVIVALAGGVSRSSLTTLQVDGARLEQVRALARDGVALFRADGLDEAATRALARSLAARDDVRYAVPNYVVQTQQVTPEDPWYPLQWHYPAIELPAAWAITTGASSTVVAVVDTGILHSFTNPSATHPELVGRVVPGYDFITDPQMAGDGDGRDPDPYEIRDDLLGPPPSSSYHGSHVAGTIAARSDDGVGLAGVDWSARILPVRVLGRGGGTLLDVVEGTLWAAGHAIPGVPSNPHPAHVINLSLGGQRPCTPFEQEAFDWIATSSPRRAVVVVAAGNAAQDASAFAPGSCRNVVTVGATEVRGHLAPYSNAGSRIDVMAPGGDLSASRFTAGTPDGVLSLTFDDVGGQFSARYLQGTSMAAPHVAGVVSLMKGLDPTLTLGEVVAVLQATARPLTSAQCGGLPPSACGAGLIDAGAAIALVADGDVPQPGAAGVVLEPSLLDLGTTRSSEAFALRNTGEGDVPWTLQGFVQADTNPAPMPARTVYVDPVGAGVLAPGERFSLAVEIVRSNLSAPGTYLLGLVFAIGSDEAILPVRFTVGGAGGGTPSGPMLVAAFRELPSGELVASGSEFRPWPFSTFAFAADPGEHVVAAWIDTNDNAVVDAGDAFGVFPASVRVQAGQVTAGVDVVMERVVSLERGSLDASRRDASIAELEAWRAAATTPAPVDE